MEINSEKALAALHASPARGSYRDLCHAGAESTETSFQAECDSFPREA